MKPLPVCMGPSQTWMPLMPRRQPIPTMFWSTGIFKSSKSWLSWHHTDKYLHTQSCIMLQDVKTVHCIKTIVILYQIQHVCIYLNSEWLNSQTVNHLIIIWTVVMSSWQKCDSMILWSMPSYRYRSSDSYTKSQYLISTHFLSLLRQPKSIELLFFLILIFSEKDIELKSGR